MQCVLTPLLWLCILIFLNPHWPLYEQVVVAVSIAENFSRVFIMTRRATTAIISVKRRFV